MSGDCIADRIDAALERMRLRQMAVRAIYLDDADRRALDCWATAEWRKSGSKARVHALSFRDHPIISGSLANLHFRGHDVRGGRASAVYSTHGCAVTVPKRLSAKTKVRA